MAQPVYIAGSGTFLPGDPVPVDNIDQILGELTKASPKIQRWMKNTGSVLKELLAIEYLHYAIDPKTGEFTEDNITMSVKAAKLAIKAANISANDIDLICYGSPHQDQMPTASVRIQDELGIEVCDELSIHANCTSAYKALYLAHELVKNGKNKTALVISSNMASSELRAEYYNQSLVTKEALFLRWFLCDGAGALLLSSNKDKSSGYELEHTFIESIGGKRPSLMYNKRPAYWMNPKEEYEKGYHHLQQRFRNTLSTEIFQEKDGSIFIKGLKRMFSEVNIPIETIKLFQLNFPAKHIVESIIDELEEMGIPRSSFYTKLDKFGYSGPPMAFICLDKIIREETLETNDRIISFVTEVSKFMQAGYSVKYVKPQD